MVPEVLCAHCPAYPLDQGRTHPTQLSRGADRHSRVSKPGTRTPAFAAPVYSRRLFRHVNHTVKQSYQAVQERAGWAEWRGLGIRT